MGLAGWSNKILVIDHRGRWLKNKGKEKLADGDVLCSSGLEASVLYISDHVVNNFKKVFVPDQIPLQ